MRKLSAVKVPAGVEARAKKAGIKEAESFNKEVAGPELPFWPKEMWAMPNALARSSLFAVIRRGPRRLLNEELIASRKDGAISMSGQQLDQADADTWMQLMRIAKSQPLGTKIHINRMDVLRAMNKGTGKSQYAWLEKSIDRLHRASLSVETARYKANLHLIGNSVFDRETGEYWITIDSDAAKLFDCNTFGYVDIEKRYKLGKNDLAKWVQTYATSHSQGEKHAISLTYLHHWCGSQGRLRAFRESLAAALVALCSVEIVTDAKIRDDDMVTWFRPREYGIAELPAPSEPELSLTMRAKVAERQSA